MYEHKVCEHVSKFTHVGVTFMSEEKKKVTLSGCLLYGLGGVLLVGGIGSLGTAPMASPGYLIAGLLTFPITFNLFQSKTNFEISTGVRIVGVIIGLGLAGAALPETAAKTTTTTVGKPSSAVTTGTTKPVPLAFLAESCADLSRDFGTQSKLSDLQKEERWKQYKGRAFKWNLKVTEVSSDIFGGFTVQFKCAVDSSSLIQDIQLKYQDSDKARVLQLTKGSAYEIKGRLGRASTLLGMTGDGI